jgi:hypothetical protein
MYWPLILLFAGLLLLGGCALYVRSKRPGPGQPYQGSRIVLIFIGLALALCASALIGVFTTPR